MRVTRKSGTEEFLAAGRADTPTLIDFWRWSSSDLLSNTTRGVLAEYIVGLALGCVTDGTRREWDAADLVTASGIRVEVKSAAYLQTWAQRRLSSISFGINPTNGWDAATNTISEVRRRQADVYVFALLLHEDKGSVEPLDLDQWQFYVISTASLNDRVRDQKSIGLQRLIRLGPEIVGFGGVSAAVARAAQSLSGPSALTGQE